MPAHHFRPPQPFEPAAPASKAMPPVPHANGTTARPETPALEGREPLPAEITGRASGTDADLMALFSDRSDEHLKDGFRGGSQDDPERGDAVLSEDPAAEVKVPD